MPEGSRRLGLSWYRRIPCDPPPEALAKKLSEAKLAASVSKRIDIWERVHHQHRDHQKGLIRGMLGATGLVLSIAPSVPSLVSTCRHDVGWDCSLRLTAMAGGVLAMGITAWSLAELYLTPSRLSESVAKLNAELSRAAMAKTGESPTDGLFHLYQSYSREEQVAFKAFLHEAAKEPVGARSRWREVGEAILGEP